MESDASQSAFFYKASAWAEAHKKQLLFTVLVILVVVLGMVGFVWYQNQQESNANAALSDVLVTSAPGQTGPAPEALAKVGVDHAGTDAGGRAVLMAGTTFFGQGKYAEARAQFEKFLREYRDPAFAAQASLGIAASAEALGDLEAAMRGYTEISTRYGSEYPGVQARLALGRLYESQNRLEEARKAYEDVARSGFGGSLSSQAAAAYQSLMSNHPELAQPPPAAPESAPAILQTSPSIETPAVIPQEPGSANP